MAYECPMQPVTGDEIGNYPDPDRDWLARQLPPGAVPDFHTHRVGKIARIVRDTPSQDLPQTIGIFGPWGSGKTTFLAALASALEVPGGAGNAKIRVVYFNAWKYASLSEILPALMYKIVKFGYPKSIDPHRKIVLKALTIVGRQLSDIVKTRTGINLDKMIDELEGDNASGTSILDSYFSRVDDMQDTLRKIVDHEPGTRLVVMIDELDRCDPAEAFSVIKQLRVFFAMSNLPIIFILSANPEPIGLAIKHMYGLAGQDYETRKILEKFVDRYIDIAEPLNLETMVSWLWRRKSPVVGIPEPLGVSSISYVDDKWVLAEYADDKYKNATVLKAIKRNNPLYSNIRMLAKSLDFVCYRQADMDIEFRWQKWHLELVKQMDAEFRRNIAFVDHDIAGIAVKAYGDLGKVKYQKDEGGDKIRILDPDDRGGTLFGVFRSAFWNATRECMKERFHGKGLENEEALHTLEYMVSDNKRMDFLAIMCIPPVAPDFAHTSPGASGHIGDLLAPFNQSNTDDKLKVERFAYLLRTYST